MKRQGTSWRGDSVSRGGGTLRAGEHAADATGIRFRRGAEGVADQDFS